MHVATLSLYEIAWNLYPLLNGVPVEKYAYFIHRLTRCTQDEADEVARLVVAERNKANQ